jgi:hypothetical protein
MSQWQRETNLTIPKEVHDSMAPVSAPAGLSRRRNFGCNFSVGASSSGLTRGAKTEALLTDAHSNLYTTRPTRPPTWCGTVVDLAVALLYGQLMTTLGYPY